VLIDNASTRSLARSTNRGTVDLPQQHDAVGKKALNICGLFSTPENRFEAQARQLYVIRLARKGLGFTRYPMSANKLRCSLKIRKGKLGLGHPLTVSAAPGTNALLSRVLLDVFVTGESIQHT
jgi:hypothetical protein